jgi:CheY-like chemotaxis protein
MALALEFKPAAITLDLHLPDADGRRILDRMKTDLATRHIPVQVITVEENAGPALARGALTYQVKSPEPDSLEKTFKRLRDFLGRSVKKMLLVEPDAARTLWVRELIGNGDVVITTVSSPNEALQAAHSDEYDCLVIGVGVDNDSRLHLLETVCGSDQLKQLPVVIHEPRDFTPEQAQKLKSLCGSMVVKEARSPERLLDETALILHRDVSKLPERQRRILEHLHQGALEGRKVLVVDDDIRNIFAMTSMLERFKMRVVSAENGRDAINLLRQEGDIEVVLMDIMLPVMDGYTTIRAVRDDPEFKDLPIIAVTAKAMKGDREKCIQAGASDYLCKPVEPEQLRSTLRVWLLK